MAYVFDPINNTLIDDEAQSLGNKFAVLDPDLEKVLQELNERFGPGTIQEGTQGIPQPKIGSYQENNYFFYGNIGPCHIYNRALSASEVLHNYNALKGRFGLWNTGQ